MIPSTSGHVVIDIDEHNKSSSSRDDHNNPTPTQEQNNPNNHVAFTNIKAKSREERDVEFDEDMLHRAIADTGKWAYGTISVEAWVLNEQTGKLVRPHRAVSLLFSYANCLCRSTTFSTHTRELSRLISSTNAKSVSFGLIL